MVRCKLGLGVLVCSILGSATIASAAPVTFARTELSVDLVSAGVGGIGNETATINLTGVSGPIRKAFLYWHGVDLTEDGGNGVYDNAAILFAGQPVVGTSIGDTSSNCWGPGSSRAYRADVTSLVTGNGNYSIAGLAGKPGHEGNGASLVVSFNDGSPINDRDYIFFEGNDADNPQGFDCEDAGTGAGARASNDKPKKDCKCKVQGDEDCDGDEDDEDNDNDDKKCHEKCSDHDGDCNPHCEDDKECHGSCNPHDGFCNENCNHDDDCEDEDCDDDDGECNPDCDDDDDCNPSCSPHDGICNEQCQHDDDCEDDDCDDDDGECNPDCDDDEDCHHSCSPHDGVCNPRCHNDDDCEECDDDDGVCNPACPHDKDCHMSCNPHDDVCNPRCKHDRDCNNSCDDDDGICNPNCNNDDDCATSCDDDDGICNPVCAHDEDCDDCDDDDGVCNQDCEDDDDCNNSCDDDDGFCNPICADDDDCDGVCDDDDGICNPACDDDDDCDDVCDDDDGICNANCADDDDCDEEPCDHDDGQCDEDCDGADDDCNPGCEDNDGQCNPECENDEDCGTICTDTDTRGWHFLLEGIKYGAGPVFLQLHASDGQRFVGGGMDDDEIVVSSAGGEELIEDTTQRWDGKSVPDAGNARADNGALWDIHNFNIVDAFDESGFYDIEVDGMDDSRDCHSLVLAIVNVAQGAAACGNGVVDEGEDCDPEASGNTCGDSLTCTGSCECGCDSAADCNDGIPCTLDSCNQINGQCLHNAETCVCPAECGNPRLNNPLITAVDSQHILNTVVELVQCPLCVCDVDSSGNIFSDDALDDLRHAVGQPVSLTCPDLPPDE